MKQTKYRSPLPFVALMVAVSLVGCAKEEPNPNNPDRMTIAPLASLGTSGVEAGSTHSSSAQTKAPVSGTDALDLYVARADQTSASAYGSYDATAITAARTAGTGSQTLTLNPVQYYRADGLKTKLTGWYPTGTYNSTTHTVSWTINGQQDIMTAPKQEGNWTSGMPAMNFSHRLTQLQFYLYAETQATVDAWGKITRIEVLNQQNTVVYNLTNDATGAVSFSGATTNSFSAGIAAGGASLSLSTTTNKVTDAKQMGNPVMIVPQDAASHTLTLRIILADNTYKDVTLTGALTAGTPYRLYMKFTERDITIETAVAQWNDVTTDDKLGVLRIGDFKDGGLVFWIDPTDSKKYKVMSLEQAPTQLTWAAADSYEVAAALSDADGKANSAAIRAYFEANAGTVGTDYAVAFPAFNYCYNYQGLAGTDALGSWHLPAKSELQYLWCAYNGVAPISWESGTDAAAPADATKQKSWNDRIKAGGGTKDIASGFFWSSTEYIGYTSTAWYVSFSNGYSGKGGNHYVRCVKSIAPPPAVGDYYYSDGSYSQALETGKTATGMIYYIDPANPQKYKIMSLEDTILAWAKVDTYAVSGAQNDADGKANSAAIRAYFEANAGVVGTNYSVAFPAFNYCYNYKGKSGSDAVGTWYVPAKSELQYLWCAYNGVAPVSWAVGADAAPKNAVKQTLWNYRIKAGGGAKDIISDFFWLSTEASYAPGYALSVNFSDGLTSSLIKSHPTYVRCVREL